MNQPCIILGAGMTGLAAGWSSGLPVFEAETSPGGICSSYYVRSTTQERSTQVPEDEEAYRFEIGGGHWIFGGDQTILRFIQSLTPVKSYSRNAAVFFSQQRLYVPYPLQNHLSYLEKKVAKKALTDLVKQYSETPNTMTDWLRHNFGQTLFVLFFAPFHEKYTAGLCNRIAPQDIYKSPVETSQVINGIFEQSNPVGYNVQFIYPKNGLSYFANRLTDGVDIHFGKRAISVDIKCKVVQFLDGSNVQYGAMISTIPLNKMMDITGLKIEEEPDPYTSVLVLNIGARRGEHCPDNHWLYIPESNAGFYRIGFYSNVDRSFLPKSAQQLNNSVSIYVERAFPFGQKPTEGEINDYVKAVIRELQEWDFIAEPEVVDPTWIEVAYTWQYPGSRWSTKAIKCLAENDIFMVGRYGKWKFQGIADSIRDGLYVGAALKGEKNR